VALARQEARVRRLAARAPRGALEQPEERVHRPEELVLARAAGPGVALAAEPLEVHSEEAALNHRLIVSGRLAH
jgi:hypothetical protein